MAKMTTPKKAGRPRISAAEKLQTGSFNKSREKSRENVEMKVVKINEYPTAPNDLGKEGKKHWDVVVKELTDVRVLSQLDLFNLRALCIEWEQYLWHREKQAEMKSSWTEYQNESGGTVTQPHPVHYNGTNHLREYMKICNEFGLSPAARGRLGLTTQEPNKSKAANLLKKAV